MERQTLLGALQIRIDELERPAQLATEGVAVHEGLVSRGVAVAVVERELDDPQQVSAMLAVVGCEGGELLVDERGRIAGVEPLEEAGERVVARRGDGLAPARDGLALHARQARGDDVELLSRPHALADHGVDLRLGSPIMGRPGDLGDRLAELLLAARGARFLGDEEQVPAPIDRDEPAAT